MTTFLHISVYTVKHYSDDYFFARLCIYSKTLQWWLLFARLCIYIKTLLWWLLFARLCIYSICRCCWNVATYKLKVHNRENWNHLFCHNVSCFIASQCQLGGVGQGMKQTYFRVSSDPIFSRFAIFPILHPKILYFSKTIKVESLILSGNFI